MEKQNIKAQSRLLNILLGLLYLVRLFGLAQSLYFFFQVQSSLANVDNNGGKLLSNVRDVRESRHTQSGMFFSQEHYLWTFRSSMNLYCAFHD